LSAQRLDRTVHAPTPQERALLDRLLSLDFRGCAELRAQASDLSVAWIAPTGMPALRLHVLAGPLAPLDLQRIPVEGEAGDADGTAIHFLLHVTGGLLREIELYREDGGLLQRLPEAQDITITVNS
jgi:hypothetical protein